MELRESFVLELSSNQRKAPAVGESGSEGAGPGGSSGARRALGFAENGVGDLEMAAAAGAGDSGGANDGGEEMGDGSRRGEGMNSRLLPA